MLRDKLHARQRALALSDGEMARRLGIPRTSYNAIKNQRYRISLFVMRRIIASFPELVPYALLDEESAGRVNSAEPR